MLVSIGFIRIALGEWLQFRYSMTLQMRLDIVLPRDASATDRTDVLFLSRMNKTMTAKGRTVREIASTRITLRHK